jgi:hypothetical protein
MLNSVEESVMGAPALKKGLVGRDTGMGAGRGNRRKGLILAHVALQAGEDRMSHSRRIEWSSGNRLQHTRRNAMSPTHPQTLTRLRASLEQNAPLSQMLTEWRAETGLVAALPPRFGEVLEAILTRLESAASFGEESCSFSVGDLRGQLSLWLDKAAARLGA